LKFKIQIC